MEFIWNRHNKLFFKIINLLTKTLTMIELNLFEKKADDKLHPLKRDLKVRFIPRIGETVIYDKSTYKVVDIEYDIPISGEETVNVLLHYHFSTIELEVPE